MIEWLSRIKEDSTFLDSVQLLALAKQQELPIQSGFVMDFESIRRILDDNDLTYQIEKKLHDADEYEINQVSRELKKIIEGSELRGPVVDEFIECYESLDAGNTDIKSAFDLVGLEKRLAQTTIRTFYKDSTKKQLQNYEVKGVFELTSTLRQMISSMFEVENITNCKKINDLECNILIQKSLNPYKSGIAYYHDNAIIIQAIYGTNNTEDEHQSFDHYELNAESKEITTVTVNKQEYAYVVEKNILTKKDIVPERQQLRILEDSDIKAVARILEKVKELFNRECAIEWIMDKKFYVNEIKLFEPTLTQDHVQETIQEEQPLEYEPMQTSTTIKEEYPATEIDSHNSEPTTYQENNEAEATADPFETQEVDKDPFFTQPEEVHEYETEQQIQPEHQKESNEYQNNMQNTAINFDYTTQSTEQELLSPLEKSIQSQNQNAQNTESYLQSVSAVIVECDKHITKRLIEKYNEFFTDEYYDRTDLITKLKSKTQIPHEDAINKIRSLRNKYLDKGTLLLIPEIIDAIQTTQSFLKEF